MRRKKRALKKETRDDLTNSCDSLTSDDMTEELQNYYKEKEYEKQMELRELDQSKERMLQNRIL